MMMTMQRMHFSKQLFRGFLTTLLLSHLSAAVIHPLPSWAVDPECELPPNTWRTFKKGDEVWSHWENPDGTRSKNCAKATVVADNRFSNRDEDGMPRDAVLKIQFQGNQAQMPSSARGVLSFRRHCLVKPVDVTSKYFEKYGVPTRTTSWSELRLREDREFITLSYQQGDKVWAHWTKLDGTKSQKFARATVVRDNRGKRHTDGLLRIKFDYGVDVPMDCQYIYDEPYSFEASKYDAWIRWNPLDKDKWTGISRGIRVTMKGLRKRGHLNGKTGTVVRSAKGDNVTWVVKVDGVAKKQSFNWHKLVPVPAPKSKKQ